jgi:hypothetical protein
MQGGGADGTATGAGASCVAFSHPDMSLMIMKAVSRVTQGADVMEVRSVLRIIGRSP